MSNLITGSSGFVGRNLVRYLEEKQNSNVLITRAELNNPDISILSDCDHIIHLAGKAHDLSKVSNPDDYYHVNFELTKRLYDAFLLSDAKKFIFLSSVKAVADHVPNVLSEDFPPDPKTVYGKSKLMAEEYIRNQPLPIGKSYFILRPCMIHGPGNKGNLNLLYKFVKKGIPYPLASFTNTRSFLSVENLCFVINELLTNKSVPSGIYNIADDEALSTNEVVSVLSSAIGRKARLWFIPKKMIYFMAKIGDKIMLPLNTDRLNKLTENYIVSNGKIKKILEVELPVQTRAGLMITANSFKFI